MTLRSNDIALLVIPAFSRHLDTLEMAAERLTRLQTLLADDSS